MRTLRLSLVGTVILVLFGGLGATVVAQSQEPGVFEPTGVKITYSDDKVVEPETVTQSPDDAYTTIESVNSRTVEATDPRLSGTATFRTTIHWYPSPVDTGVVAHAVRLVNDEGAWTGTGRTINSLNFGRMEMLVLSGEGAYEGLTAFLVEDLFHTPGTAKGVIIEGELPAFPEPIEPAAG
jgi:hypothetical protein